MEQEQKNMLIVGVAALFRAARIVRGELQGDSEAIKDATTFVNPARRKDSCRRTNDLRFIF